MIFSFFFSKFNDYPSCKFIVGKRFCGDYCSDPCEARISDVFFCGVGVGVCEGTGLFNTTVQT